MDLRRLARGEWVALAGGLLLAIALFVKCYEAQPENRFATLETGERGVCGDNTCSFWAVHDVSRWLILLAALAPFILAYIVARDYELSWPRGQVTSVVAIFATGLIFYFGIIERPGDPSSAIELEIGWYGMMLGGLLMLVGSFMRQSETEIKRKPPGTL
jgi:hypothetical protein